LFIEISLLTHISLFCAAVVINFFSKVKLTVCSLKNQLDPQFIFSIFRQTLLHVSGVSTAHLQEVHSW